MKSRVLSIFLTAIVLISIIGCNKSDDTTKWSDIYITVFESLMEDDKALNADMKYIAINVAALTNATEEDIDIIFDYFGKYNVDVIDESYQTLEEKGMVLEYDYIEGVLLDVTEVRIKTDNKVIVEASKFRSGTGAIGSQFTVEKEDGVRKITGTYLDWIS